MSLNTLGTPMHEDGRSFCLQAGEKRKVEDATTVSIFYFLFFFLTSFYRGCPSDAESQPRVDGEATRRGNHPARARGHLGQTWGRRRVDSGGIREKFTAPLSPPTEQVSSGTLFRGRRKWKCVVSF